jgi:hypothetical protein
MKRRITMQQLQLSDSEIIRRVALIHLVGYPNGIRFGELKTKVENHLSQYFPPDDYNNSKFRSALWDLEKRYPQYVEKESISRKNVVLRPTGTLLVDAANEVDDISIPDLSNALEKRAVQTEIDVIREKSIIEEEEEDDEILAANYLKSMRILLQEFYDIYERSEYKQLHEAFRLGEGLYSVPFYSKRIEDFDLQGSIFGIVNLIKSAKEKGCLD